MVAVSIGERNRPSNFSQTQIKEDASKASEGNNENVSRARKSRAKPEIRFVVCNEMAEKVEPERKNSLSKNSFFKEKTWHTYDPENIAKFYRWRILPVAYRALNLLTETVILRIRKETEPDIMVRARKVQLCSVLLHHGFFFICFFSF